jgi:ActR/RegA family two-component response regulator
MADPTQRNDIVFDAVDRLLDEKGLPERGRAAAVQAILGIPDHQARRRLNREIAWSPQEVSALARHFRVSAYAMLGAFVGEAGVPAVLQLNGMSTPCVLWPGATLASGAIGGPLVCVAPEGGEGWLVVPAQELPEGVVHAVQRCVYEAPVPHRIAVIDDEHSLVEGLCQVMRQRGVDAVGFTQADELMEAMEAKGFDGYVIDWLLSGADARRLLQEIRRRSPEAPILILTGQIRSGGAGEDEVADAVAAFRCQVFEKPTRALSLLAALRAGLDARRP